MSRREEILAEMGLAPVWKLRERKEEVFPAEGSIQKKNEDSKENPSAWIELKQAVPACIACGLHKGRAQTVFGVGDENADWLLVGEAPGAEEDRLGEPFVGQAGKLLDSMLAAINLTRGENVYIANVLKCRPPGNRNPEADEVAKCTPHLLKQIELIRPKLIVAMGRFAAQTLLGTEASIASLRGRLHQYAGVPLIVTYHPAYLLRTLPDKAKAWQDLVFARKTMQSLT
jgi:uracil-DNA glycosylase